MPCIEPIVGSKYVKKPHNFCTQRDIRSLTKHGILHLVPLNFIIHNENMNLKKGNMMFSMVSRGLKRFHWYRLNQSHVSAQRGFHNWNLIATLMWCLNMLLSMARMFVCLNPLSVLWPGNVPEHLTNSLKDLVKWFFYAKGSWRFWTHPTSLHPQWLSSPQISRHNEAKSHKTC